MLRPAQFASLLLAFAISLPASAGIVRDWTDLEGKREVHAELIEVVGEQVTFRRTNDGQQVTMPVERLSVGDQHLLRHWADPAKKPVIEKFSTIGWVGCEEDGSIILDLTDSGCSDEELQSVLQLPETARITLVGCRVSNEGIKHLQQLKRLKQVSISQTQVDADGIAALGEVASLERISFSPGEVEAAWKTALAPLSKLANLKVLSLYYCRLGAKDWAPLGQLASLESLTVVDSQMNIVSLSSLANLTNLRRLHLTGIEAADDALNHLAGLHELQELILDDCRFKHLRLDGIAKLPKLERLHLPSGLTDSSLAPLAGMTSLKSLQMAHAAITDDGMQHLSGLVELEVLTLPANVTPKCLVHLKPLVKLKELRFTGEKIALAPVLNLLVDQQQRSVVEAFQVLYNPGEGKLTSLGLRQNPPLDVDSLKYLVELPDLDHLTFSGTKTDRMLAALPPLKRLESIYVGEDGEEIRLTDASFKKLAACESVQIINLTACNLRGDALAPISGLPKLQVLDFRDCSLRAGNAAAIGKMQSLEDLSFSNTNFADEDGFHLQDLKQLHRLELPESFTLEGLAKVVRPPRLKALHFYNHRLKFGDVYRFLTESWNMSRDEALALVLDAELNPQQKIVELSLSHNLQVSAEDLSVLHELAHLERLTLPHTCTDAGLANIADLTRLKELSLESGSVTDAGIAHLARLKNLEVIYIGKARKLTDKSLQTLAKLTYLKELTIIDTQISDKGIADLRLKLPAARIQN
jgi:Leucine-rich repeat (LRR) protein